MKFIRVIPYNETKFKWISNHYDIHLNGICLYDNETCYFSTVEGDWNEEKDEYNESFCKIYKLTLREKWGWFWRQKKFEWMVGYHWTYPHRKQGTRFYIRKPIWLYRFLLNLFYKK